MVRCFAVLVVLCGVAADVRAEEPPRELKEMIEKASGLLEQGKYLEYYQLTTHPRMREAYEKGGISLEKLALIMEKKPEVQTVFKKAFTAMKSSGCQVNKAKTEATFQLPGLAETKLGGVLSFELFEKRWYMSYK